ncbi:MAG: peptidoglycan DD-metalloendopeptidase family protein [Gammaproteobacteria bacterium]
MAASISSRTPLTARVVRALCRVMVDVDDPLDRACAELARFHARHPLREAEVASLHNALTARLRGCATDRQSLVPVSGQAGVDHRRTTALLERLRRIEPALVHYLFRGACGWPPCPAEPAVVGWLAARRGRFASVFDRDLKSARKRVLQLGHPAVRTREDWADAVDASGAGDDDITIGRYAEARALYDTQAYASRFNPADRRNVHLGLDLGVPAGTPVHAPLEGTVHSFADNDIAGDYGPTVILEHRADEVPFYTLYGHLQRRSLDGLEAGRRVGRAQRIGRIGAPHENGGWPAHLHFQIMTDMLGMKGNFYGVGEADKLALWKSLCPDPELIVSLA